MYFLMCTIHKSHMHYCHRFLIEHRINLAKWISCPHIKTMFSTKSKVYILHKYLLYFNKLPFFLNMCVDIEWDSTWRNEWPETLEKNPWHWCQSNTHMMVKYPPLFLIHASSIIIMGLLFNQGWLTCAKNEGKVKLLQL